MKNNRRDFIKNSSSLAAIFSVGGVHSLSTSVESEKGQQSTWPIADNPKTPRLCVGAPLDADVKTMRRIKQTGIDHVLMGGPNPLDRRDIEWNYKSIQSKWFDGNQYDDWRLSKCNLWS